MKLRRRLLLSIKQNDKPKNYIKFEDKEIERICIENWSSDNIGVTEEDAKSVKSFSFKFQNNIIIKKFKELSFFINIKLSNVLGKSDFKGCSLLNEISLPINYNIPGYAFNECNFTIINNLETIKSIGEGAFYKTTNLIIPILNLPQLTGVLYNRTFNSVKIDRIESLGFITDIEKNAFSETPFTDGKNSPIFIRFPKTLLSIKGDWAFHNYERLTTVIFESINPPIVDLHFLDRNEKLINIYVPDISVDTYKNAPNWSALSNKIKPLSEYIPQ